VLQVLFWGEVTEVRENTARKNWECRIKGHDLEGEPLIIKLAILDQESALVCITVHGE
jgi:hypothetical protein